MANSSSAVNPAADPAQQAQKGILIVGILLLLLLLFGGKRQLIAQQFVSASAGNTTETELIDVAGRHSPSVEVVTQLQYTQEALFKAEVIDDSDQVISEISQDLSSNNSESKKQLKIADWPDPRQIKVKLTVASQSIAAAPPEGITAAEVPVIFEINVYRQRLNPAFLWPGLFACIGLSIIVGMARRKANAW